MLLAGCGGTTKTVVETVTSPPTTSTPTSATSTSTATTTPAAPDCSSVDAHTFVGKCTSSNGATFNFVNRDSTGHLQTLDAKVVNVATAQSVSNGSGFTANAHGTFVMVTIAVTNTTHSPQTFDEALGTYHGTTFNTNWNVESVVTPTSLASADGTS